MGADLILKTCARRRRGIIPIEKGLENHASRLMPVSLLKTWHTWPGKLNVGTAKDSKENNVMLPSGFTYVRDFWQTAVPPFAKNAPKAATPS